jgi:uncharacterized FlgJ-related protein
MERDNRLAILLCLTFLVIAIIFFFGTISNQVKKDVEEEKFVTHVIKEIAKKKKHSLTDKEVLDYIISLNIRFPKVVLAQAKLETGNYKSHVFQTKKNLFGMKLARSRPTTGQGSGAGYAHYKSWKESVIDYALLQTSYYRHCRTEQQYMEQLQRTYCENNMYIAHLRELMK